MENEDPVVNEKAEELEGHEESELVAKAPRVRRKGLWIGGAVAAALLLGALAWWFWPASNVQTVSVLGADYTTNMRIDDHNGYVYVYVPVNADVKRVVVQVADKADSKEIRGFLDTLDTLVPGEHVLELSNSNLHFIVDGMEE